jgi:hypothetical protein
MIRLRHVSVSFPSPLPTRGGTSPPPVVVAEGSTGTTHGPRTGTTTTTTKTYLVPSGLVLPPPSSPKPTPGNQTEGDLVRNDNETGNEARGKALGKSKYVICRGETFRAILARKKGKLLPFPFFSRLRPSSSPPPRLLQQMSHRSLRPHEYADMLSTPLRVSTRLHTLPCA